MSSYQQQKNSRARIARENQRFYKDEEPELNVQTPSNITVGGGNFLSWSSLPKKKTKITFIEGTTNDAIHHYHQTNLKCAIMNSSHVGGEYTNGAMSQEEELCLTIPDLYPSLMKHADQRGQFPNFQWRKTVKYLKDLSLYRLDNAQSKSRYSFMTNQPIKVSVITTAAPNLRNNKDQIKLFTEDPTEMMDEIKAVIKTCCMSPLIQKDKVDVLVLGAFGCGAFALDEDIQRIMNLKYNEMMASLFLEVLVETPQLLEVYDQICFAIPRGDNYTTFRDVFKSSMTIQEPKVDRSKIKGVDTLPSNLAKNKKVEEKSMPNLMSLKMFPCL